MVDVARYFLTFLEEESCGKCVPCREGIRRMRQILNDICEGNGQESDIDLLKELSNHLKDSSLCALGSSAPNPVLTTIEYFLDEYKAHIIDKKCPAGVCKQLIRFFLSMKNAPGAAYVLKPVQRVPSSLWGKRNLLFLTSLNALNAELVTISVKWEL
jgi:NADH-quinone oxidoreductase subunit F